MAVASRVPIAAVGVAGVVAFECWRHADQVEKVAALLPRLLHSLFVGMTDTKAAALLPSSPPDLPLDIAIVEIFGAALLVFKLVLQVGIVIPVSRFVGAAERDQPKIALSVMEVVSYGGSFVVGAVLLSQQWWLWPSRQWFENLDDGSHWPLREDLRCYYLSYMGRYIMATLSTVFFERHAKDFWPMLIHHFVTLMLCSVSYASGYNRIGGVLMVLFDFADVPLHLAKLCKYFVFVNERVMTFLIDRFFEMFGVAFFVTRIVMYGYVCWVSLFEREIYFPVAGRWPVRVCLVAQWTLMVLQIWWMCLLVKAAMKHMKGGIAEGAGDLRSDSEDEAPEQNKKTQ